MGFPPDGIGVFSSEAVEDEAHGLVISQEEHIADAGKKSSIDQRGTLR